MKSFVSEKEMSLMAESAAPDPDRLMPVEMAYEKTDKTISFTTAIAMLTDHAKNPGKAKEESAGNADGEPTGFVPMPSWRSAKVAKATGQPAPSDKKAAKPLTGRVKADDVRAVVEEAVSSAVKRLESKIDSAMGVGDKASPGDRLAEFKELSHTVTFRINGMSFSVKCLNMFLDSSTRCLVVCFDSSGDSFFTPPTQSELEIEYDSNPVPYRLFYFGMSFSLPPLGLRFLGFLCDDPKPAEAGNAAID